MKMRLYQKLNQRVFHLAAFILTGEVDILDLVDEEKLNKILASISPETTPSILREKLGSDFSYGEVKAAFDNADFKKDIIFTGYVSDEEVVRLTAAAQAFVYVSNFEGFGIPILEAMHCDVPVITSITSSMPEVAGDAALLVNPESVKEIANALNQLAFDANLRQYLIEKGSIQRTKFSWEKTADIVYDNILKTILTQSASH